VERLEGNLYIKKRRVRQAPVFQLLHCSIKFAACPPKCKEEIEMSAFQGNENVRFGHFC